MFLINNVISAPLKSKYIKMSTNYIEDLNIVTKYNNLLEKTNYNTIINNVIEKKIDKLLINIDYKQIVSVDNLPQNDFFYNHYHIANINPVVLPNLIQKTSEYNIPIYFVDFNVNNFFNMKNLLSELYNIANFTIPVIIFLYFLSFFGNIVQNPMANRNINKMQPKNPNNPFDFFQKKTINNFEKPNVTLSNWAGSPEVIEECNEVISYIENKEKYQKIGAEMPKGILLEGPPGTGKTLLAKAIASSTNSTFISMSGSEFVELFVGMGAARVRELFDNARQNKPCIIFIDEIDAIGKQRGGNANIGNDEREQTLNQLLYEMDGFNNNDDIVIMAATNRKDVLDKALLRPGRFDRIIQVSLPDKQSRIQILEYYLNSKNLEKEFDILSIAELTDGFSGAQLKNLINEAAIISARNNYTMIQEKYIFDAFEKSIVGLIRKNATIAESTKLRVSLHEAGHTLLALKFNNYFDFQKVSIQPTYNGAGGYTIFSEKSEIKEGGLYTKDLLKKRLIITMGGKAAESIYYGNDFVSMGAIQDLNQANSLAKRMIGNFGMGNKLEVFYNEDINDDSFLVNKNKYSENTKYIMDKESLDLVKEAYIEAVEILNSNKNNLINFSELLRNNTVLYKKDIGEFNIL